MIFGYNTDVKSGRVVYHVQTEDRGEKNPVIDSVIYVKGRIVDRRRTPYHPGETSPEKLQEMVKAQHRELVDAIRGGTYVIPEHTDAGMAGASPAGAARAVPAAAPAAARTEPAVSPSLELVNSGDIERDGRLVFRLQVRDRASGQALAGATVRAVLDDGQDHTTRRQVTASADGTAEIDFGLPPVEGATVLFQAGEAQAAEILRFRLMHRAED